MKTSSSVRARPGIPALARLLALVALVILAVPSLASAQSLDALRADGTIGERYDGTVVVRTGTPSPAVLDFVAGVNAQRQKIYADRAAQQGVPVGQVARIYAKEIYAKLPAGAWFLDESGTWRQK